MRQSIYFTSLGRMAAFNVCKIEKMTVQIQKGLLSGALGPKLSLAPDSTYLINEGGRDNLFICSLRDIEAWMYGRGETGVLGSSRPEHPPCVLLHFLFCKGILTIPNLSDLTASLIH